MTTLLIIISVQQLQKPIKICVKIIYEIKLNNFNLFEVNTPSFVQQLGLRLSTCHKKEKENRNYYKHSTLFIIIVRSSNK